MRAEFEVSSTIGEFQVLVTNRELVRACEGLTGTVEVEGDMKVLGGDDIIIASAVRRLYGG